VGDALDEKWSRDYTHCQCPPNSTFTTQPPLCNRSEACYGDQRCAWPVPQGLFSRRWLIGGLGAANSESTGAIKRGPRDAAPFIPPLDPSLLPLISNSWWPWRR
jgi:hypothetical protein